MAEGFVTRSVLIGAGAGDVWDALVDPSRLEDWFADEVDTAAGELVAEAEVVFRWGDGTERVGVVEEVDAPRRLTLGWAQDGGEQSTVEFELTEESAGTRVTVIERGLTVRAAAGRAVAWGPRLSGLRLTSCAVLA
ncbi:MAG TPA: SRPBCC domain-containing protein [Solirubrobacteraceae bacterium]